MRVLFLLAMGITLAAGAFLALHQADARCAREAEARERALREAGDQQAATAEILGAIAASPSNLQTVFDAIARNAVSLCRGVSSAVFRVDGGLIHVAATQGFSGEAIEQLRVRYPLPPGDVSLSSQVIRDRKVVHVRDLLTDPDVPAGARESARLRGVRSQLVVPMLRDDEPVGAIGVTRTEPGQFPDTQVALLQTFADQAVIAIENARLFQELQARNRELTEALDQQTATAEILRVISSSPTDLQPALEAVAESAARLCESRDAIVFRVDGGELRPAAVHGAIGAVSNAISPGFVTGRAVLERRTIHVEDLAAAVATDFPDAADHQRRFGHRTTLATPLLREGVPVGAITIRRLEVRRFTEGQVRLLETFAAQAVIAIENARLFQELQARNHELSEALEQQTATAEILRVISSSPTDLAPVMDAVARNATRLARADHALIGEAAEGRIQWLATSGCPLLSKGTPISRQLPSGRAILDCQTTQVEDVTELTADFPAVRRAHDDLGVRTILATPLVREGLAIGVLLVRRTTVRPFSGKEIELLRTFADQAVIAIENVRLFQKLQARNHELTESLEQQTATSEILSVISSSPSDLQPVLDTIASSAAHLCGATDAQIFRVDGDSIRRVASHGPIPTWERIGINRESVPGRAVVDRRTIHVRDMEAESDTTLAVGKAGQREIGFRTVLATPLLREGVPLGAILIRRMEVHPFADNQVRLLETFAAQAVIAIENVRLFQELRTRNSELTETLDRQTATSEMLQVISRSPTEVQPVFDAIARSGRLLCSGKIGGVFRYEDGLIHLAAAHGMTDEALVQVRGRFPAVPGDATLVGRAIRDRDVVNVSDLDNDPRVAAPVRASARLQGVRSQVVVPMLRDNVPIGAVTVSRADAGQFSESHIALLRTFDLGLGIARGIRDARRDRLRGAVGLRCPRDGDQPRGATLRRGPAGTDPRGSTRSRGPRRAGGRRGARGGRAQGLLAPRPRLQREAALAVGPRQ